MKKTLVALAIASAFTGAAYAQSSVTMYGIVDAGVQVTDPKKGNSIDQDKTIGLNSGMQSGSRFGVRGSEALGGGLNAIFTLENGYSPDTGQLGQGNRLFGRQAWVGLNGGFGSVVMGRVALFSSGTGSFDKFGSVADIGSTGFGYAGTQSVMTSSNAVRLDNTIAYVSPKFAGASFGWAHSFRNDGSELAGGAAKNNHADAFYVDYGWGPLQTVVTYDRIVVEEVNLANEREEHYQFAANYNLGFMKLLGAYAHEKNLVAGMGLSAPITSALQSSGQKANAWSVGALFPFGAHTVGVNYQQRKWDNNSATTISNAAKRETFALEYQYNFSKRTNLYAYYTEVKDKDAAKTANWGGAQQYAVGLRHAF